MYFILKKWKQRIVCFLQNKNRIWHEQQRIRSSIFMVQLFSFFFFANAIYFIVWNINAQTNFVHRSECIRYAFIFCLQHIKSFHKNNTQILAEKINHRWDAIRNIWLLANRLFVNNFDITNQVGGQFQFSIYYLQCSREFPVHSEFLKNKCHLIAIPFGMIIGWGCFLSNRNIIKSHILMCIW